MRVAIAWEDSYFRPLERVVVARREALRPVGTKDHLELLHYSVNGNGKFARNVSETWPRAKASGHPRRPGPIDHLICVADADKIATLIPAIESIPADPGGVDRWHESAEAKFVDFLRQQSDHPKTVHGVLLRWAKESLTLAAYDLAIANDTLGIDLRHPKVVEFLASCTPHPHTVADAQFSNMYKNPIGCVDKLRRAQSLSAIGKGSFADDVVMGLAPSDIAKVCLRVPDVDRLIRLSWQLIGQAPRPQSRKSARR